MTFIIKYHSIIDVITNSSSELFVAAKDGNINVIKELIIGIMKDLGYPEEDYYNFFDEPYIYDASAYQNDCDKTHKWDFSWGYEAKHNIGSVFVQSACDNSIPWDIVEKLEYDLGWNRYHLG